MLLPLPSDPNAPDTLDPIRIQQILLDRGLLTADNVRRAERIQSRLEHVKPLTQVAVDLGWLATADIEEALREHRRELSVEGILITRGVLSLDQVRQARTDAAAAGHRIDAYLIQTGAVMDHDYLAAWCEKHGRAFDDVDPALIDRALLKPVSLKYLARNMALPLRMRDGRLEVAVDRIEHEQVVAELGRIYHCPVDLVLSTTGRIERALASLSRDPDTVVHDYEGGLQYHDISDAAEMENATGMVDQIFVNAIAQGASDIHVEPLATRVRVRYRVDGSLVEVPGVPRQYAAALISRLKILAQADIAERRIHQDGRINLRLGAEEVDMRASFYVTVHGESAVLRVLRRDRNLVGLEELGMAPMILRAFTEDVLDPPSGIVLVTGPTGSGKTTTLYASVDRMNDSTKKIITCEDPVEYVIDGISQCSVSNRPGINFADSLKAIVRQDPDVILIGEIRDRESAEMAVHSALTGHKVLSTLHTEDSVGALVRLIDMDIEGFLIASTVTAVIAQRLVRRQCPHCRADDTPKPEEVRALAIPREDLAGYPMVRGRGCPRCLHTGFRGRVGLYEMLMMTDALRDAILQKRPSHELRRVALETANFVSLQEDGIAKSLRGETTFKEVLENAPRVKQIRPLAQLLEPYA